VFEISKFEISKYVAKIHNASMKKLGFNGQSYNENTRRTVHVPLKSDIAGQNIAKYESC
jgi:hypothetical protein